MTAGESGRRALAGRTILGIRRNLDNTAPPSVFFLPLGDWLRGYAASLSLYFPSILFKVRAGVKSLRGSGDGRWISLSRARAGTGVGGGVYTSPSSSKLTLPGAWPTSLAQGALSCWRRVVAAIGWSPLSLWSPSSSPESSLAFPLLAPGHRACPGHCPQSVLTSGGADHKPISVPGGCKSQAGSLGEIIDDLPSAPGAYDQSREAPKS